MSPPTNAAGSSGVPAILECRGFELVGYHDLGGQPGFKLALAQHDSKWFLYLGHLWKSGWSVLDVTNPAMPELVRSWDGPQNTWTIQVQAAEGTLITGLEKPAPGWGFDTAAPSSEGAMIWDIARDPTDPQLLGVWRTGSAGTHRNFYAGGSVVMMAARKPGFIGNVLRVVDISDRSAPREIAYWALDEQREDSPHARPGTSYLHGPAHVQGNRAYLPHGRAGLVVLDISDIARPTMISRVDFGDLGGKIGCHSAVPVPGRNLLVVNSEAIEEGDGDALNYTFVVDISDDERPRIMSAFPMPRPEPGLPYATYYGKGGRFGPHNQHHPQGNPAHLAPREHIVMTYFNAGLRLFDIGDPVQPVEVGYFVPEDPRRRRGALPTTLVTQFEDVLIDARGAIYCTDKNHGLFILRYRDGLR